ncbi:uncharacterized protein EV420DRAFT_384254 [Desarmillaria tabescens]|uniref:DUF6534 domain-containing protein n=1 Tax=Armillaria tabescens TaxID=1929756 RepID=A0AA39KC00_ARMTA|nr:uncharacterized protein EV420DRAFT_384254 [Desarmillaria tabescens]KAK0458187.1 hypothetical protein EV420DRAFT_384254 [Desarmillaria tabescens]
MPEVSLDSTFGAFLIGAIVSAFLFGITCMQTWYYYVHYSDSICLKVLVGIVWTLEAVHAVFACHAAYFYVVTQYGNLAGLSDATWSASLTLCVTGIITFMVHLFYARQLYLVSNRNVILVSILLFLAVCRVASSAAIAGYSMKLKSFALFQTHVMTSLLRAGMSFYLATDFLVAASLCFYLHTSRTGHKRTDTIINRLIIYTINNGLLTGVTDLLIIAFEIAYPNNLVYLSLYQVVANLYFNSFLATLNSRQPTKMTHIDNISTDDNAMRLSSFEASRPPLGHPSRISGTRHIDIHITSTTGTIPDPDGDTAPELEPKAPRL